VIDPQQLWSECSKVIKTQVSEATWKTWFSSIIPVEVVESTFVLSVPNDLVKGRLQSRFNGILAECVSEILGSSFEVELHISPSNTHSQQSLLGEDDFFNVEYQKKETQNNGLGPKKNSDSNVTAFDYRQSKYSFETFVIGQSNRFAHAAALSVAETPGRAYNPLFIIGDVGLGKTHLLQAIRNYTNEHFSKMSVLYISAETFMNEFIDAIRNNSTNSFKKKYRACDVLLIDDIQFIEGKESLQEEFFHTFNSLYEASKQVVLTSDRPPGSMKTLESRLRSRFLSGLIADIQPPEFETRLAILRTKSEHEHLNIPDEVLEFIAENVKHNIRELEGALIRVHAYASLNKLPLNKSLAEEILSDIKRQPKGITVKDIVSITAKKFDFTEEEIRGPSRQKAIVLARQIAMYVIRELTDFSYPSIAKEFGGRDHTTVMHAVDRISKIMSEQKNIYDLVTELITKIKEE
jgi:chromosomal replication initiator protein